MFPDNMCIIFYLLPPSFNATIFALSLRSLNTEIKCAKDTLKNCPMDKLRMVESFLNSTLKKHNLTEIANLCSACLPNPCMNNGTCHVTGDAGQGYNCSCTQGYSGHHCEKCKLSVTY